MKNQKLNLEKLQISKLTNLYSIHGGNGGGETATAQTEKKSTLLCKPTKKKK